MKNSINRLILSITVLAMLAGCNDEPELTQLASVSFSERPTASTTAVVLSEENLEQSLLTINWKKVVYPIAYPVTYTIQFALPIDTLGATAWTNISEIEVGEDVYSASFTGNQLRTLANELGLQANVETPLAIRIVADMDRPIFSKSIGFKLKTYETEINYPALWIAGDFQGWNIGEAVRIVSVNDDNIYEGYFYIPAGGTYEFKLYAQPAWEPTSYGFEEDGKIMVANYPGANFVAPSEGYYLLMVNTNDMTFHLAKTDWGIAGDAAPNGWGSSTPLEYNPATQTWTLTADMNVGAFKFRANNDWAIQFGNVGGKLAYADHPWMEYVELDAFSISAAGNYTITLDLHNPGNYKHIVKKN